MGGKKRFVGFYADEELASWLDEQDNKSEFIRTVLRNEMKPCTIDAMYVQELAQSILDHVEDGRDEAIKTRLDDSLNTLVKIGASPYSDHPAVERHARMCGVEPDEMARQLRGRLGGPHHVTRVND